MKFWEKALKLERGVNWERENRGYVMHNSSYTPWEKLFKIILQKNQTQDYFMMKNIKIIELPLVLLLLTQNFTVQ